METSWDIGYAGEQAVSTKLSDLSLMHPGYTVFNNVLLPGRDDTLTQIDHLVLSKFGIFIIETKHYSGKVTCEPYEENWTVRYPSGHDFSLYNPLRQNFGHKVAVMNFVAPVVNRPGFMQALFDYVCFSGTADLVDADDIDRLVTLDTLISKIRASSKVLISAKTLRAITRKFTNLQFERQTHRVISYQLTLFSSLDLV